MLLRRMIDHVRAQNWLAVGLDFVIVVVGVFIGIQLGNLNEARVERETGYAYLALIADEMEGQADEYSQVVGQAKGRLEDLEYVAGVLDDPARAAGDPEGFLAAIYFSRYRSYFPPPMNVYEGLESSGDISLLPQIEVLSKIRQHYSDIERWNDVMDSSKNTWLRYGEAVTGYLSAEQMAAILAGAPGPPAGLEGYTGEEAVALATRMADDRALMFALPVVRDYHNSSRDLAGNLEVKTRALLVEVNAALGRPEGTE